MINKSLIKKRFSKSLNTYSDNAFFQKEMAEKLINLINKKEFNNILEIGCGTGILTKKLVNTLCFKTLTTNDIVSSTKMFIDNIYPNNIFLEGDIEEIKIEKKYDLIISNACLQWCNNIDTTIKKLVDSLNNNGILAISIFGNNNLKEIKEIFRIQNQNYTKEELKIALKKYKIIEFQEENKILYFDNLTQILRHLKATGVNAIKQQTLTKTKLEELNKIYSENYTLNNKVTLTYNPIYILIMKNDIE